MPRLLLQCGQISAVVLLLILGCRGSDTLFITKLFVWSLCVCVFILFISADNRIIKCIHAAKDTGRIPRCVSITVSAHSMFVQSIQDVHSISLQCLHNWVQSLLVCCLQVQTKYKVIHFDSIKQLFMLNVKHLDLGNGPSFLDYGSRCEFWLFLE